MHNGMNGSSITPASAWLSAVEEVRLPSGKVAGLRAIDVMHLLSADGKITQVLRAVVGDPKAKARKNEPPTPEETLELAQLADRVVRAAWAQPPLAEPGDPRVAAGEAITLAHIAFNDKMAVLTWGLGGQAAIDAANAFLVAQDERVESALVSENVQSVSG